jgi:hypothetical protein
MANNVASGAGLVSKRKWRPTRAGEKQTMGTHQVRLPLYQDLLAHSHAQHDLGAIADDFEFQMIAAANQRQQGHGWFLVIVVKNADRFVLVTRNRD